MLHSVVILGKGASIEAMDTNSNTPLLLAAQYGHTNLVEMLLGKGALIEAMQQYPVARGCIVGLYRCSEDTSQERRFN